MRDEVQLESRVLSLHVGEPRTLRGGGRERRSAIFKREHPGPLRAGPSGLEGDAQADLEAHGGPFKALCVYSLANTRHFAQSLSRPDLGRGAFGENLCVEDLADECVCIGDIFEIGGVVARVSQPRAPCSKLAMKFDLPELPKLFLHSGRLGFYLQVLEEGELRPGDCMRRIEAHPERLSVAAITRLVHFERDELAGARRALAIEALSPDWRRPLEERLHTE